MAGPVIDPNTFVLTTFSENITNPNIQWRNSIIVETAPSGSILPADPIVGAWRTFIAGCMRNDSRIVKTSCRKWTRGAQPFFSNPALFEDVTEVVGFAYTDLGFFHGTSIPNGTATVGEVCVRLAKQNAAPALRAPSIFLRNCARQEDLLTTAGGPPAWNLSAHPFDSLLNTFATTTLGAYLGPPTGFPLITNVEYSAKHSIGPTNVVVSTIQYKALTMHNLSRKSPK